MHSNPTALITGASKGLGYALAETLAEQGWKLLITARNKQQLEESRDQLASKTQIIAIPGDIGNPAHREELVQALVDNQWRVDLLVNNASTLGVSPLPSVLDYPIKEMQQVFHTNVVAPIALLQEVRPYLTHQAHIINISSDAGKEIYEGWGIYGASKSALDHLTAILAKEHPHYHCYAFDPGDMQTEMHQAAFPGEDISDRPLPQTYAVPALLHLINQELPSGRYTVNDILHPQSM